MHDNVDDLIESALNTKLLSINSQRLDKKEQEVKNIVEQPAERGNRIESLQNFRVIRKSSISLNTSQISSIHAIAPILSTKEPEHLLIYDDYFEDIEYVEALLSDPEIISVEEENVVHQAENDVYQEEEIDLEDISQIQDVVLREKLLSITRLIANIESLNDNPNPNRVFNSFESDNSLLDNFSPEFETFCDHLEETRSGKTTTYANNSLPEYDSFRFEPDQERLINAIIRYHRVLKILLIDPEGDVRLLEELLIDDSILSHESSDSNFDNNPSIPRPPPKPPDAETDTGEEIPVVMNDKDKFDEDYYFYMFNKVFLYSSLRVRIRSLILDLSPVIEVFLCWILVPVSKIFTSFDLELVWGSPYPLINIA
uniref:Reverse transcriptase domain-containing protein n=1 Tax=Tanacetum cinerariifolium TaxID=118510 RepID=A0A6L2M3U4_TANCI|nr:hypothetical protein [Tanacetum cinerariifolium]